MKTRNGFVSNSSSSSFIIALPSHPTSISQVHEWLFNTSVEKAFVWNDQDSLEIATIVYNDVTGSRYEAIDCWCIAKIASDHCEYLDVIEEQLTKEGFSSHVLDWSDNQTESLAYLRRGELALQYMQKFIQHQDVIGKKLYVVEYGDNSGPLYASMEHCDLFENIPHIRSSRH